MEDGYQRKVFLSSVLEKDSRQGEPPPSSGTVLRAGAPPRADASGVRRETEMVAVLERIVEELTRPAEEIRAEDLRRWAEDIPGTSRLADVSPRQRARVAGVVTKLRIDPPSAGHTLEATISDGTGRLKLRWLGRETIAGLVPGKGVVAEGVVADFGERELLMLDPAYELVPSPEHS